MNDKILLEINFACLPNVNFFYQGKQVQSNSIIQLVQWFMKLILTRFLDDKVLLLPKIDLILLVRFVKHPTLKLKTYNYPFSIVGYSIIFTYISN